MRVIQVTNYDRLRVTYLVDGKPTCLRRNWIKPGLCSLKAGQGTNHSGEGACNFHSLYKEDMALKTGKYVEVLPRDMRRLYEELLADPEFMDLTPELAAQKTLAQEALKRYGQTGDTSDLRLASDLIEKCVKTVDKIQSIQSSKILSIAQARLLMLRAIEAARTLIKEWFPEATDEEVARRMSEFTKQWKNVEALVVPRNELEDGN